MKTLQALHHQHEGVLLRLLCPLRRHCRLVPRFAGNLGEYSSARMSTGPGCQTALSVRRSVWLICEDAPQCSD